MQLYFNNLHWVNILRHTHTLVTIKYFRNIVKNRQFSFYNFEEHVSSVSTFDEYLSFSLGLSSSDIFVSCVWWVPDLVLDFELLERKDKEFEGCSVPLTLVLGVPNPPLGDLLDLRGFLTVDPDICLCRARHTWPMKGAALVPDTEEVLVITLSRRVETWTSMLSMMSLMSPISSSSLFGPGSSSILSR